MGREPAGLSRSLLLARSAVDRAAAHRSDPGWVDRARRDDRTRVLPISAGRTLVRRVGDRVSLEFFAPAELPPCDLVLLGVDEDDVTYFAARTPGEGLGRGVSAGLREVATMLSDRDLGLLVSAVGLDSWHSGHRYCPRCGGRTAPADGGHVRICLSDGSRHYPRLDPAVIALVRDGDDRCLLARARSWPEQHFSVITGYVDLGESLEQAVLREIAEEVGIVASAPVYVGSQLWPFPGSLMAGFFAEAVTTAVTCDGAEIVEARWWTRQELTDAMRNGKLRLPPKISVGHHLIEAWYGQRLPSEFDASPDGPTNW
ncbi:NAD(+) diphosphatase [Micromonospora sp. NPDC023644]|uniref:NAD(+) diphosphatase n=1 Tax=Micromonospora sp. NPDC023644 TaxID=3154321 RepID=UPI0033D3982E